MQDEERSGWSRKLTTWVDQFRGSEQQLSLLLSLTIGAVVGLVVVAFILLTGRLAAHMYPAGGSGWRRVLAPTLGALVTGFLLHKFFPEARGSGVPQTKAALFLHDGDVSFKTAVGKFLCCATSLASGISLGREGPSVQIAAGISSTIGRRLGLTASQRKALIPVASAAALAAAFNTPISAVLFSLEEIMGDLHAPVLGSAVIASATSWMVLHMVLTDDPLFHVAGYKLVHPVEFLVYGVLGIVGGLTSVAFVKLLLWMRAGFMKWPAQTAWFRPAVGGLAVGIMGYFVPQVLGVGYNFMENVLNGVMVLKLVVLLIGLRIVATAVCYASGNAGGIFGPALFIGAVTGAALGSGAHYVLPDFTAQPGAYALVGMGTAFAGIIRTPLTSVIMIFEITRDYTIIVPLMISNMIAYGISCKLQPVPIYEALQAQDRIHLPTRESSEVSSHLFVSQVLKPAPAGFSMESPDVPHLHLDHGLSWALKRMGDTGRDTLPVVSRADVRQVLGVVTLEDILEAYGVAEAAHHATEGYDAGS
jgi:CIC family chloride channel protein